MSVSARIGILLVALVVTAVSEGCRPSGRSGAAGEETVDGPVLAKFLGSDLGSAKGEIVIEAILPVKNGCQDDIGVYAAKLADLYPKTFRTHIFDMRSDEGKAVMRAHDIKCAAVIVNGTTRFDVGGEVGKVLLEGPMDPLDLYSVLVSLVAKGDTPDLVLPEPVITCAPNQEQRRKAGF